MIFKKCIKCGALVKVIKDCNCEECGITCCENKMEILEANVVDAAAEKHVPTYERVEDEIFVKVNHVMEKDHYIMFLAMEKDGIYFETKLYPEQNAECRFKYMPGATLYAYCNKHSLWSSKVK